MEGAIKRLATSLRQNENDVPKPRRIYSDVMSAEVTKAVARSVDRREQFRAYMKAFNPTAPAREMIQAGLVVDELHGSLYRNLAGRADLEPGSQQVLEGLALERQRNFFLQRNGLTKRRP